MNKQKCCVDCYFHFLGAIGCQQQPPVAMPCTAAAAAAAAAEARALGVEADS
jgi:hypothetical protein